MARLIVGNETHEITDGIPIAETCAKAGVPFNCNTGVCGSCLIKIVKGAENLSDLTPEEKTLGLDRYNRLACQCAIIKGVVEVTY
ncbi:MAG TPA: 2Fe-2S iron-sulfur cluster-binding protein [Candidatus Omnitrophota bacterium]|nr:2Fe-2S iron-sulfur cluster-binding protein [Candidatus Omnitrophota bacterium]HPD85366.1 2Fe-2S iron-sulfur cluster-binding protein [Candidatus Omnitrophota bacterium]HRZ04133.1 2Fe-2S iron-sulfur cluster-binding protein [Candidatus Omnitrophota bacterium]